MPAGGDSILRGQIDLVHNEITAAVNLEGEFECHIERGTFENGTRVSTFF